MKRSLGIGRSERIVGRQMAGWQQQTLNKKRQTHIRQQQTHSKKQQTHQ